ncbi:DUF3127 domain-containing protein [bacterium SCSIO 12643]|nr:DUF3127 domain-containing protein [bacterium SCSIO 12643]
MDLQLQGRIKVINDTQTFDSGFSKREFVITTQEQYPQDVKFEFFKDKTTVLDTYNVNDDVTVHFNIRGNEYNGRYYVNLQAWKMEKAGTAAPASPEPLPTPPPIAAGGDDDDLPF